jgi:hypothetical protein
MHFEASKKEHNREFKGKNYNKFEVIEYKRGTRSPQKLIINYIQMTKIPPNPLVSFTTINNNNK